MKIEETEKLPAIAQSLDELAGWLRVSRRTLAEWRKHPGWLLESDEPLYTSSAIEFMHEYNKSTAPNRQRLRKLELRRLDEEIARLRTLEAEEKKEAAK